MIASKIKTGMKYPVEHAVSHRSFKSQTLPAFVFKLPFSQVLQCKALVKE